MTLQSWLTDKAYDYLTRRDHARAELKLKLLRAARKIEPAPAPEMLNATISDIMERLTELHLLDDARFAESFVKSRLQGGKRGKQALSFELKRLGIEPRIITEVLAAHADPEAELHAARALIAKRSRKTPDQNTRYLLGKGFTPRVVYQAIKTPERDE